MSGLAYPVKLTPQKDGSVLVTFPGLPGAVTDGDDEADALYQAADCLDAVISALINRRMDIPVPAPARGRHVVPVAPELAAKVALYTAMREQRVTNTALAERLGVSEGAVRKLVSPRHVAKIDTVARALRELGLVVTVSVSPVQAPTRRRHAAARRGVGRYCRRGRSRGGRPEP